MNEEEAMNFTGEATVEAAARKLYEKTSRCI